MTGGEQEAGADALTEDVGPTFPLDVTGPSGERLRTTVKTKLSEFMGSYTDDVLAEYVVVLVGHGKHQKQATADLEAFLGHQSETFVSWLWDHLTSNRDKYTQEPAAPAAEQQLSPKAPVEQNPPQEDAEPAGSRERDLPVPHAEKLSTEAPDKKINSEVKSETRDAKRRRSRSPEPWSRRRRTRADNKDSKDSAARSEPAEKSRHPRLKASRLLEFAMRDAVTAKPADTSKRLRSVVDGKVPISEENAGNEANGGVINKGGKVAPAMFVALKAAAAAAEDVTTWKPRASARITQTSRRREFRSQQQPDDQSDQWRGQSDQWRGQSDQWHGQQPPVEADTRRDNRTASANRRGRPESRDDDQRTVPPERKPASQKVQKARQASALKEKPVHANADGEPQEVMEMRKKMRQVQLEMTRLKQKEVYKAPATTSGPGPLASAPPSAVAATTTGFKTPVASSAADADSKTVQVTNVHFAATKEALSAHFSSCGDTMKVTLLTDGVSGKPKGTAYVEFSSKDAVDKALSLNESCLLSRPIRVVRKDAAVAEPPPATIRPPLPTIVRPVRMPVRAFPRAAFMRGAPYMLRPPPPRLLRPPFPAAPHLQWKRDASGSGGAAAATSGAKNGFRSNVGPIRMKRSLSYVRPAVPAAGTAASTAAAAAAAAAAAPTAAAHPPEASTGEQKGS